MNTKEIAFYERQAQRFLEYLPNWFYPESLPLRVSALTHAQPIPFASLAGRRFRPMREGAVWGRNWSSAWFRLQGRVPGSWRGQAVVARLNFAGEACVFSPAGEPLQGLSSGSIFAPAFLRERFPLFKVCRGGEPVHLLVEAAANDLFGLQRDAHPVPGKPYTEQFEGKLALARLCVFRADVWRLYLEVQLLFHLMRALPERDPQRAQLLHGLSAAANLFRYDQPNPAAVRRRLAPLLAPRADATRLTTTAVGHAHIDTAWLWPMRETVRKCGRTFASQLRLIEQYPDYIFGASQAQLYQFVKQHYPRLYRQVQRAVAAGRWEVQGAMWVEADCNVTGGESLVRQVLYGKLFFREEFGIDVRNLWLPDVFGYSAALPQILRQAGVNTFLTQKISWSQFNRFPHHAFIWKGIDGTGILTHFPPEDTYNSELAPERLRYAAENFEERGFLPEFMTLFGIGDGGGGPTAEMIETGRLQRNLAGCPRVRFGRAQAVFDRLARQAAKLPVWSGELYLELHRGTLTTQAANKRANRLCELALRRTEMLHSALPVSVYPHGELTDLWKKVLTNQFHDIIPGSSIREVYVESRRQYRHILPRLARLEAAALRRLRRPGRKAAVTLINLLTPPFAGAVRLPNIPAGARSLVTAAGRRYAAQGNAAGGWAAVELPALSATTLFWSKTPAPMPTGAAAGLRPGPALENELVRYEFNPAGRLTRIWDKEQQREFMRAGEHGNRLTLYQDWPEEYDAWDVDITYESQIIEHARLEKMGVAERGPVLAALAMRWRIGESAVTQEIRLAANSRRLDFVTRVNWRECRKMLRVAFPVDIVAREAVYEIQYGIYRRPTHRNTSWDLAQFEVCGHRFADLSGPDGGVALLNDCKYGYKILERTLDMNLLRAPWHPDPTADRGEHYFTYSLLPHPERFEESATIAAAHALNQPPLVAKGALAFQLPFTLSGTGILVETLKKAEAEPAWIARLYEPAGRPAVGKLHLAGAKSRLWEAGIMENRLKAIACPQGAAVLKFRPFEIKTLLIQPAG